MTTTLIENNKTVPNHNDGIEILRYEGTNVSNRVANIEQADELSLGRSLRWLTVLERGLGHRPYLFEARHAGKTVGVLPLAYVSSRLFGRYLVSLPYVNSFGVNANHKATADALVDAAVELTDELDVRHLQLRHEVELNHSALSESLKSKVLMQLALPSTTDELWSQFRPKVRNQIRKGQDQPFDVSWGSTEQLDDFYSVFSRNMRDLGTPVFPKRLFVNILEQFPDEAEFCVVRDGERSIAAGLLVHGEKRTEVPSASSLREYNKTNANMLMYWHLLQRTVERHQEIFDFGRSSIDGNTFRFKKQWGAQPVPTAWQYYIRSGTVGDVRPDNPKYELAIDVWRRLPVSLTRIVGPVIARGIP